MVHWHEYLGCLMLNIAWLTQWESDSKLRIIPNEMNTANERDKRKEKERTLW